MFTDSPRKSLVVVARNLNWSQSLRWSLDRDVKPRQPYPTLLHAVLQERLLSGYTGSIPFIPCCYRNLGRGFSPYFGAYRLIISLLAMFPAERLVLWYMTLLLLFWVLTPCRLSDADVLEKHTVSIFSPEIGIYIRVCMSSQPKRSTLSFSWNRLGNHKADPCFKFEGSQFKVFSGHRQYWRRFRVAFLSLSRKMP
jgi:hypothetical protein